MSPELLREAAAACLAEAIERQGLGPDWPGPSVISHVVALIYPAAAGSNPEVAA